jgi:mannose-6-phosphate isomerase-like protein (cupin superfamily)
VSHRVRHGFDDAVLTAQRAHEGIGEVRAARVVHRDSGPLAFVDLVVVPAGVSVGRHVHGLDEELYIVVSGRGDVVVDGARHTVVPGDVVHNPPGGTHELSNPGPEELRMVVVDVRVERGFSP